MFDSSRQLDLFAAVLHSYTAEHGGTLDNATLYRQAAQHAGIDEEAFEERTEVGVAGKRYSLPKRAVRWHQQTLKAAGILERVPDERGVWRLTQSAGKDLDAIHDNVSVVGFSTELGVAILGSCESVFSKINAPIALILTSPPYALSHQRAYGNVPEQHYVDWCIRTLEPLVKNLVPGGTIALNISNDVFLTGLPARSMYRERLLLSLNDKLGLAKVDEAIWHNPAKAPGPIQWASLQRQQLNTGYEPIYILTNDPSRLRSDNRRVLVEHSKRQLDLIARGGESRSASYADGAYRIKPGAFGAPTPGAIPRNVLTFGHTCADQRRYKAAARAAGLPVHGAPMPLSLASFLVKWLSAPDDLVCDPFAGSFTTARAAELLGRRWLCTERMLQYVQGAALRFHDSPGFLNHLAA